jgi:hypothetical protein
MSIENRKTVRTSLKIAVVYAFALMTAVACAKVDSAQIVKGTNNGNITTSQGTGGPLTADSVQIVSAVHYSSDEFTGDTMDVGDLVVIEARHGTRTLNMQLFPPSLAVPDSAQQTVGTIDYTAQAACASIDCREFAVMITVTDTSNGTVFQLAQMYHSQTLVRGISTPSRTYQTVQDAYIAMTGQPMAGY